MQARHAVRAGLIAHAVTFGMLALMLGLIHVAPLGATPDTQYVAAQVPGRGYVRVNAVPWAKITIDGKSWGTTPIAKAIELPDGRHVITFEHEWYAPVERPIEINGGSSDGAPMISVDYVKDKVAKLAGKDLPPEESGK